MIEMQLNRFFLHHSNMMAHHKIYVIFRKWSIHTISDLDYWTLSFSYVYCYLHMWHLNYCSHICCCYYHVSSVVPSLYSQYLSVETDLYCIQSPLHLWGHCLVFTALIFHSSYIETISLVGYLVASLLCLIPWHLQWK